MTMIESLEHSKKIAQLRTLAENLFPGETTIETKTEICPCCGLHNISETTITISVHHN